MTITSEMSSSRITFDRNKTELQFPSLKIGDDDALNSM